MHGTTPRHPFIGDSSEPQAGAAEYTRRLAKETLTRPCHLDRLLAPLPHLPVLVLFLLLPCFPNGRCAAYEAVCASIGP